MVCRHRNEIGSSLVELAIALPVLLIVFFGTVDFARVIYVANALTNAARAGAQFGSLTPSSAKDLTGIEATAEAASPASQAITATVSLPSCFCETNAAVATATTCASTCPGGQHLSVYVTVTTSATFARVTPFPGIPATIALTRAARMRVAN